MCLIITLIAHILKCKAENNFTAMEPTLHKISKILSLGDDKKKYVEAYEEISDEFIRGLQEQDPLFKGNSKIQLTGSYYEKTKIRLANEFNTNICIKLPFDYKQVLINNGPNGEYVTIQIPGQLNILKKLPHKDNYKSLDRFIDEDDFILQKEFRQWMQSVSQKTLNKLNISSNSVWSKYNIVMRTVGPSISLFVSQLSNGIEFLVDFVPVLEFRNPIWPRNVPEKYSYPFSSNEWYAVPKHPFDDLVESKKAWRMSFPQQEYNMLKGKNQMKVALRLIKQLREKRQFTFLKSYFIKNLFMLMNRQKTNDSSFWSQSLSNLFMFMLQDLYERVCDGNLPFFWDLNHNLLSVLTKGQLTHCKYSLMGAIDFFHKNFTDDRKIMNFMMLDDQPNKAAYSSLYSSSPAPAESSSHESSALVLRRHFESNNTGRLRNGDEDEDELQAQVNAGVGTAILVGAGAMLLMHLFNEKKQSN